MRPLRRGLPEINWRIVLPVQAGMLFAIGIGMGLCAVYALFRADGGSVELGVPAGASLVLGAGGLLAARRLPHTPMRQRDGFVAVTLAWVVAATAGAVPLYAATDLNTVSASYFEAMSGFTTTGATMLQDIPGQPGAVLMWRSLTQWMGGVGIVVLVVAVAPATGMASQRVFYAETSGVTPSRLTPRIADTAKIIAGIYLAFSALAVVVYLAVGMSVYDAVIHMFTSVATGGFSPKQGSIADFESAAVDIAVICFMIAGGVNFAFYWRVLRGHGIWPQWGEVRVFLTLLASIIAVLTASVMISGDIQSFGSALRSVAFNATSLLTGTGYINSDFDEWNDFARLSLVAVMFLGGCAGSTTGGLKTIRVILLAKSALQEVRKQVQPRAVQVLRTGGETFDEEVRRGVMGFFFIYVLVFVVASLLLAASGLDMQTAFGAAAATINIIGPGIGEVGGTESYAAVPEGARWVLIACMLIGRLEVFTVLVLLIPAFWRRAGG